MRRLFLLLILILIYWASAPQAQLQRLAYLTPVDGSGTDADPYRSRCWGMPGSGNIDLRPLGIDRWLCASDVLPKDTTGIEQLGGALNERMTASRKNTLDALAQKTLTATTVHGAIAELLQGRLRPEHDGKVKIYLGTSEPIYQKTAGIPFEDGGLIADANNLMGGLLSPFIAWATTLSTETFTASNGALGGCESRGCTLTWTQFQGSALAVATNQASVTGQTGINQQEARADHVLASGNHWAQATIVSMTSDGSGITRCGPIARKDSGATRSFYGFFANHNVGAFTQYETIKRISGTFTSYASDATDPVAGEVARVYVDGSNLSGYVDGSLRVGPTTLVEDLTANQYTGIGYSSNNPTTQSCLLDNFSASDIETMLFGPLRRPG